MAENLNGVAEHFLHFGLDVEFDHSEGVGEFGIDDPAVQRLGEIVHDVDLKEDRYGHPESAVVNDLVEGLRRAHPDDQQLLEHGMTMFGGLYESFRASRPERPPRKRAGKSARAR